MRLFNTVGVAALLLAVGCTPAQPSAPGESPAAPSTSPAASDPAPAPTPAQDHPLEDTLWTLTGIVRGEDVAEPVGMKPVTLTFSDGTLHAEACNIINGEAIADGDTLQVGPLASTKMACESEEEMLQEGQFVAGLESALSYEIDGSQLVITTAGGSITFAADDKAH